MSSRPQQIARLVQGLLRSTRGRVPLPWMVALGVLFVGYLVAQPYLEKSLGVSLPGISADSTVTGGQPPPNRTGTASRGQQESPQGTTLPSEGDRTVLREVGREVYESPAGLRYTPGTQHGHRLKHLLAHAQDQPNRPGQHGVFDSQELNELVLLVDEAYEQALTGWRTKTEHEEGRIVYTVDLGRRIGYVGGQSGNRRGKPTATHLKLVLQGKKVITAFPYRP